MKKVMLIFAALTLMIFANIFAQDPPRKSDKNGCSDYPGISRYKGAIIQECNKVN